MFIFRFVDIKELIKVASTMGFSLDVEDLRICLNEVDEVGHQIKEGVQKRRKGGKSFFRMATES